MTGETTTHEPDDDARRARLLLRLTLVMLALALLGAITAALEPRNDWRATLVFYGVIVTWLLTVARITRRGQVVVAAWLVASMFWVIIAAVTLLYGGLQGQSASCFAVCVLLIGTLVGGRAAIAVAVISAAWCGVIALLDVRGALPTPIAPYSPINAWGAVTITLLLTATLLASTLDWLRELNARVLRSARERDEALRRSIEGQKMELVGKLTAGIAHDFNNLLTVMVSVIAVLRQESRLNDADSIDLLEALEESVARASLLTRQLVSLGTRPRPEAGPVDVGEVVGGLARMLPHLLGSRIAIETRIAPGAVAVAPRAALEQILVNLAVNAKEALPSGGRVKLVVEDTGSSVVIVVEDDGVGMDEATRARIFEPFFTTKAKGTGLGLATVHRLTTELGGTITAESEPGKGARFTITLPRSHELLAARTAASRSRARAPAEVRRVLVVEDDPLVRRTLARWLASSGFEPIPVADAREALALSAATDEVACVVSDIAMPGMDGVELAARLAETRPALPVVLISGDRAPSLPPGERRRAFVPKPLTQDGLVDAIDDIMQA